MKTFYGKATTGIKRKKLRRAAGAEQRAKPTTQSNPQSIAAESGSIACSPAPQGYRGKHVKSFVVPAHCRYYKLK
jgi:hypothetical protein